MNTHVITMAGIKGGIGKTTLAVNIAIALASKKNKVLVIDANVGQYSSAAFIYSRSDTEKNIIDCKMAKEPNIYEDLSKNEKKYSKYNYIIIDVGGTIDSFARSAILSSCYGLLILVTQPSIFDMWALGDTLKVVEEARKIVNLKAYALVNMVMPYKTKLTTDTFESLDDFKEKYKIDALKQTIGFRTDFKGSIAAGKGVIEYAPRNKAAKEIRSLVDEIEEKLREGEK